MARGYEATEQAFGVGDIVTLTEKDGRTVIVKIIECIEDDDGWWYEIYPVEFEPPITREVPQAMLEF